MSKSEQRRLAVQRPEQEIERLQQELALMTAERDSLREEAAYFKRTSDQHFQRAMENGQSALEARADAASLRDALKGVLSVADRKTKEFDAARAAIAATPAPDAELSALRNVADVAQQVCTARANLKDTSGAIHRLDLALERVRSKETG